MIIYMSVEKWSIIIINSVDKQSTMIIYECGQVVHHNNQCSVDKWSATIIYMSVDKQSIIIINTVQTSSPP